MRAIRDPDFDIYALDLQLYASPRPWRCLTSRYSGIDRSPEYIHTTLGSIDGAQAYLAGRSQDYDYPTSTYYGSCHCQAIKFAVLSKPLDQTRIMDCSCSICAGVRCTSDCLSAKLTSRMVPCGYIPVDATSSLPNRIPPRPTTPLPDGSSNTASSSGKTCTTYAEPAAVTFLNMRFGPSMILDPQQPARLLGHRRMVGMGHLVSMLPCSRASSGGLTMSMG
jgi:hypothetical protein